jgi:hypothetical protein
MTRPGASESKKRCHDLLHRDSDSRDYLRKVRVFRMNLIYIRLDC